MSQRGGYGLTTSASTNPFSANKYLLSPRRSNQRRQKAKVPKFLQIVLYNCLDLAFLIEIFYHEKIENQRMIFTERSLVQRHNFSCNEKLPYRRERHLYQCYRMFLSHKFHPPVK